MLILSDLEFLCSWNKWKLKWNKYCNNYIPSKTLIA